MTNRQIPKPPPRPPIKRIREGERPPKPENREIKHCLVQLKANGRFPARACGQYVWKDGMCKRHHPDFPSDRERAANLQEAIDEIKQLKSFGVQPGGGAYIQVIHAHTLRRILEKYKLA